MRARHIAGALIVAASSLSGVLAQTASPAPSATDYQSQITSGSQAFPPSPPADMPRSQAQEGGQTQDQTGASPQPAAVKAARISDVSGDVQLARLTGKDVDQARLNMAVLPGTQIETAQSGQVEVELVDGTVLRVTPGSAAELLSAPEGRASVRAERGLVYMELPAGSAGGVLVGPFLVSRSERSMSEAALLRINLDVSPYEVGVLRGTAHFEDAGRNIAYDVEANQTARIDPAAPSNYDIVLAVTPDSWDGWNSDREAALAEIASAQPGSADREGEPGWSDLDYYGSWYNLPGQGMAWAPDGVDQGFDPYGSGAWGYSEGVGYSWISSYPWGWLPYHCGAWSYFSTYGWMWLPSNCNLRYGGFYPYSGAYNGPDGYRVPLRPVPARGITRLPPSRPVVPIDRGPAVHFRAAGEPRPVARPVLAGGMVLDPVAGMGRPVYAGTTAGGYGQSYRTTQGVAGGRGTPLQPGQPGYGASRQVITPAPGVVTGLSPRVINSYPNPGGRLAEPAAPRMSTPPPGPRMSAPTMQAPSAPTSHAAPAGHGH